MFVVASSMPSAALLLRHCRAYPRVMADVVFFHHSGGLTVGVKAFADTLRAAGHTVHTPDLFEGRTFAEVSDGVAYVSRWVRRPSPDVPPRR